ncbi:MAG: P-type DNA transfer protein VirB5 [Gallionellaceae bacterium]|nr:P-type DNA transfer protein VirB5 [Gallionellaceae bacterium]
MKILKKTLGVAALCCALVVGNVAHAGIPVIDASNLAQQIQQVVAWGQQAQQMIQQLEKMKQQYDNLNGARGMANLVNNPAARQYLPADYQTILNNGVGNWAAIRAAAKVTGIEDMGLLVGSDAAKAFEGTARQAAINRAASEEAYKTASQRFSDIQVLLDKVNAVPDAKDIADLQGRIQAEQVMMQNEANKLQMLVQLASAQRDLQQQQAREISIKALKGSPPRF